MSPPDNHSASLASATSTEGAFDALVCEISEKIDGGVRVELSDYELRHPEFTDRLRRIWPTLLAMADLGHLNNDESVTDAAKTPNVGILGDFQIIREVGRGGMGVVYEATQISLGRRVALKVLPFASVMDKRQLQRFKNEAMAAAALDHPNIVNVFATGCERSVHFYAMHFVAGHTLAEVIAQLRSTAGNQQNRRTAQAGIEPTIEFHSGAKAQQPGTSLESPSGETKRELQAAISTEGSIRTHEYFRSVAEIGKQAAEALDYAHGVGIVHRDVKPSNLILDESGRCWITDFGLAMVESSTNLTMTGDLLGTLRYMSPEQSLAQRVVIDHRTDVYSLGVTLYELLTLQPAHTGDDRQELLRRLAFEEPPAPRKLNPKIPEDLETIVFKAISKNPSDRYATAGDLANDLRRFLNGEPIEARRPTLVKRLAKWSLRHKPIVGTAATLILLATISLAVSNVLIADQRNEAIAAGEREQEQREAAQLERDRAEQNLYLAEMRQSAYDLASGSLLRLRDTLNQYEPVAGKPDLRRWEWYYFRSLLPENLIANEHPDAGVQAVSWTESPVRLFTTVGDKYVSVWDPAKWVETKRMAKQQGIVNACDVHETSSRLATGSEDGSITVWNLNHDSLISTVDHGESAINWVGWSPDGRFLASQDERLSLKIWDLAANQSIAQCILPAAVNAKWEPPVWSPTSRQVAVLLGSWRDIVVLDIDDTIQQINPREDSGAGAWNALTWNQQGTELIVVGVVGSNVTTSHDFIECWDPLTSKLIRSFPQEIELREVLECATSPDGKMLATASRNTIDIWDFAEGTRIRQLQGHLADVWRLAWSPDGRWLASGSRDRTIRLWNTAERFRSVTLHGLEQEPDTLSFSHDSKFLVSRSTYAESGLRIWNVPTEAAMAMSAVTGSLTNATPSPSGELFAAVEERDLRIFNAHTGERQRRLSEVATIDFDADVRDWGSSDSQLAWSPSGDAVAWIGRHRIGVWDLRSDEIRFIPVPTPLYDDSTAPRHIFRIAWSSNGRRIAIAMMRSVIVADVESGEQLFTLQSHSRSVDAIAWSAKNFLATGVARGWVHIWEESSGRLVAMIPPRGGPSVKKLAWSTDGNVLAIGYADGEVSLWNATRKTFQHDLPGHSGEIHGIAWRPDGQRLATYGNDHSVRLWEVPSGGEILTLDPGKIESAPTPRNFERQNQLADLVWDESGQRLTWLRQDGFHKVWDASPGYRLVATTVAPKAKPASPYVSMEDIASDGAWALEAEKESKRSVELRAGMLAVFNIHNRALSAIEEGKIEIANTLLKEERQKLDTVGALAKREPVAWSAVYYYNDRWLELGIEFYNVGAWKDAVDVFDSFTFSSSSYTNHGRRYLWYYVLALARNGNEDRARPIFTELVEQFPAEARALDWDKPLLVEATQLMLEHAENESVAQLLGPSLDLYRDSLLDRAKQHVRQEMWDEAARDNIAAIVLAEDSHAWNSPQKQTCLWTVWGSQSFPRAAELRPDLTTLWIARGQLRGLRRDWTGAVKAYELGFVSRSIRDETIFEYAASRFLSDDAAGYEALCKQLIDYRAEPDDTRFAFIRARTCALRPSEHVTPEQLIEWAEAELVDQPMPRDWHLLGLAHYRAGHFEQAIEHLDASNAMSWAEFVNSASKAQNWLVLAMCHHQLGQAEQAAGCLDTAKDLIRAADPEPKRRIRIPVPDWMGIHALLRETEALLKEDDEI